MDVSEKQKVVVQWLQKTLETNKVCCIHALAYRGKLPAFEFNSETTELLFELASKNEARDTDAELLLADLQLKTEEYRSESARFEILGFLDAAGSER
jgi:hypothetical protein